MQKIVMKSDAPEFEPPLFECVTQAVIDFDQSKIVSLQAKAIVKPRVKTITERICFLNSSLYFEPR